jgi:hypothetical protein
MEYTYKGVKLTDPDLKGKLCKAIRKPNGKCIRGKKGTMLVEFENGIQHVIVGRFLRKIKTATKNKVVYE